jgi:hypothetical protein
MTMMLPADWGCLNFTEYWPFVDTYSSSQATFFTDFSAAWEKLITNGNTDAYATSTFTACSDPPPPAASTTGDASSGWKNAPHLFCASFALLVIVFC